MKKNMSEKKKRREVRASRRTGLEGCFGSGEEISRLHQTVVFQWQMAETQLKVASAKRKKHLAYETVKSEANLVPGWLNPGIQTIFPESFSPSYSALLFFHVGFVPRQVLPMPWQMVTFSWSMWPKSAIFVERVSNFKYADEPTHQSGWRNGIQMGRHSAHPEFQGLKMGKGGSLKKCSS